MKLRTPGLTYKPVTFSSLPKSVWVVKDHDSVVWVDLRTVIEAIGMSWHRWKLTLAPRRGGWKFDSCLDRNGKETLLIEELHLVRWLIDIEPMLRIYPAWVEARAGSLRGSWRVRFDLLASQEFPDLVEEEAEVPRPGRKRKITAETVVRVHQLRTVVGKSISQTAQDVEISQTAVKSIEAGTYKAWTPDAREAWRQTFGSR